LEDDGGEGGGVGMSKIAQWFLFLPKLQMRIAIGVLEKHGLLFFYLCGGAFIGCAMFAASPIVLFIEVFGHNGTLKGLIGLPILVYILVGWWQVAIPWFMIVAIIFERLDIGLSYGHVPNSRLDHAKVWSGYEPYPAQGSKEAGRQ
jgi:hypothetical protein